MPNIYVRLDGQDVVEAGLDKIEGGVKVSCTMQQCQDIFSHHDATSDGKTITGTSEGENATKFADMKSAIQLAKQLAKQEQQP